MSDQDTIIRLISHAGSLSQAMLSDALGLSAAEVEANIQSLIRKGLPIDVTAGPSYSLFSGVSLLSDEGIAAYLSPEFCESVEVLQAVESTNTHLLAQTILNGRAKICVAEAQSAGRGRRGNDWQSAPYRNVMMSLSWGFDHWPETITGLGLAVALVVVETINDEYGLDLKIKWPNDLMMGQDKLAGILIDVAGEPSGSCNVVIGLGLNVHQPDWSNDDAAYRWLDLASLGVQPDRNKLIGCISDAMMKMLSQFADTGFAPLVERWNALSSYSGKRVRVGHASAQLTNDCVEGVMKSVDSAGALLITGDNGIEHRFADSNVSVRLVDSL